MPDFYAKHDFSIHNIPFGIAEINGRPAVATRILDLVVPLHSFAKASVFSDLNIDDDIWKQKVLNPFIALGKPVTTEVRKRMQDYLATRGTDELSAYDAGEVKMMLPVSIGDYTDFYSSKEHATNVGIMFRDPDNALLPNWLHLPVGYHGRASSINVSGTPVRRPMGQTMPPGADTPVFGPSH